MLYCGTSSIWATRAIERTRAGLEYMTSSNQYTKKVKAHKDLSLSKDRIIRKTNLKKIEFYYYYSY